MHKTASPNSTFLPLLAVLAAALFAGCAARQLATAPEAQLVRGNPGPAAAESAGVRLTVESDAWSGEPPTLKQKISPLRVTIENRSSQPLRIRYNEFKLETPSGDQFAAIPPLEIEGSAIEGSAQMHADRPIYVPRFTYSRFSLAPWYFKYYFPYFIEFWPWHTAFDRAYYDRYYPSWEGELPTRDMRERAIPEGVIEPDGRVSGFLYFRRMPEDIKRVTLRADLMNGVDGNRFGEVHVPFEAG